MLAVKAPGSEVDIAPNLLTGEATTHSKAEFQRGERFTSLTKQEFGHKGDGKGKKKGWPKGGAQGGGSSSTQG